MPLGLAPVVSAPSSLLVLLVLRLVLLLVLLPMLLMCPSLVILPILPSPFHAGNTEILCCGLSSSLSLYLSLPLSTNAGAGRTPQLTVLFFLRRSSVESIIYWFGEVVLSVGEGYLYFW